ncbi:MAG TPA: HD domain-containing phosphohydrolase [Chloroflexota bacterium]
MVSTRGLRPGMVLARAVYSERGDLLLNADVPLTDRYIALLDERGYGAVYVRDLTSGEMGVSELVPERVRRNFAAGLWGAFEQMRGALSPLRERDGALSDGLFESPVFGQTIRQWVSYPRLDAEVGELIEELVAGPPVVGMLATLPFHGYLVPHAIDSTAIAIQLGRRIGYKREELHRLAVGCLLHDVGMAAIDPAILDRRGRLSQAERAEVERHPAIGYHILRALRPSDVLVQHVAYQHHERQDARGYPRGLRGTNQVTRSHERVGLGYITLDAEIVAVADVYAALSGGRRYRAAMPPEHVVRVMARLAGTHLNRELVAALLTIVPVYPLGTEVYVKSGPYRSYRGIVVRVHREALDRPTIRLLYDDRREPIQPIEVDLRGSSDTVGCVPLSGYLVAPSWDFRPGDSAA